MTSEKAPERIDIWVQSLCRELRQAGYFVPYERMMLSIQNVGHHVTAKDARIAELEAALKPFADAADEADEWGHDEHSVAAVSVGDCRIARAALTHPKPEGER